MFRLMSAECHANGRYMPRANHKQLVPSFAGFVLEVSAAVPILTTAVSLETPSGGIDRQTIAASAAVRGADGDRRCAKKGIARGA